MKLSDHGQLTCYSCRHSIGSDYGLWCEKQELPAHIVCLAFEYEPGTDEAEREKP